MTLTRLVFAWLPVAVEFLIIDGLSARSQSVDALVPREAWRLTQRDVLWRSVEAAGVTLFGSLWFDSLGRGGWWLLFALVGFLVGVQRLWQGQLRLEPRGLAVDVTRYILAGGILAWRLG